MLSTATASATRLTVPAKLDDVTRILSTLEADLDAPKLSPPRTLPHKHHTSSTHPPHRTTAAARAAQDLWSRSHKLGSHLHRECRLSPLCRRGIHSDLFRVFVH
jgi:hypothetical protein